MLMLLSLLIFPVDLEWFYFYLKIFYTLCNELPIYANGVNGHLSQIAVYLAWINWISELHFIFDEGPHNLRCRDGRRSHILISPLVSALTDSSVLISVWISVGVSVSLDRSEIKLWELATMATVSNVGTVKISNPRLSDMRKLETKLTQHKDWNATTLELRRPIRYRSFFSISML